MIHMPSFKYWFFWLQCVETRLAASDQSSTSAAAKRASSGRHSRQGGSGGMPSPSTVHFLKNGGGTGWNWEVVLGGTDLITPKNFVDNLKHLAEYWTRGFCDTWLTAVIS